MSRDAKIIPFVDLETMKMRQDAVRRLRRAGIFAVPPELDGYEDKPLPEGKIR